MATDFGDYDPKKERDEAASNDPRFQVDRRESKHDPYAPIKPVHENKGKPAKRRTILDRVRAIETVNPSESPLFKRAARMLGFPPETIERMDLGDLLVAWMFVHALRGNPGYLQKCVDLLATADIYVDVNQFEDIKDETERIKKQAHAFYTAVIESPSVPLDAKLKAQKEIANMYRIGQSGEEMTAEGIAERLQEINKSFLPDFNDKDIESVLLQVSEESMKTSSEISVSEVMKDKG